MGMKKVALVEALQALETADHALMSMMVCYEDMRGSDPQREAESKKRALDHAQAWQEAVHTFDNKRVVVRVSCDPEAVRAFKNASDGIRSSASKLFKHVISSYDEVGAEVRHQRQEAFEQARRELGFGKEGAGKEEPVAKHA